MDVHGPCPATNEHARRDMDMISSQNEALNEISNAGFQMDGLKGLVDTIHNGLFAI